MQEISDSSLLGSWMFTARSHCFTQLLLFCTRQSNTRVCLLSPTGYRTRRDRRIRIFVGDRLEERERDRRNILRWIWGRCTLMCCDKASSQYIQRGERHTNHLRTCRMACCGRNFWFCFCCLWAISKVAGYGVEVRDSVPGVRNFHSAIGRKVADHLVSPNAECRMPLCVLLDTWPTLSMHVTLLTLWFNSIFVTEERFSKFTNLVLAMF